VALGFSLLVTAVGAILRYAYTPSASHGFHWPTVGAILMIFGIVGIVLSLIDWAARMYRIHRPTSTTAVTKVSVVQPDKVDSTAA
jgi:hypothetical protein